MKKCITVLLSLVLCLSLSIPAFAANSSSSLVLTPVDNMDETNVIATDSSNNNAEKQMKSEDVETLRLAATNIRNMCYIRQIEIKPIVFCTEDQQAYIMENISRNRYVYTGFSQFDSLRLSPEETTALINEITNSLNNQNKTYSLIGWSFKTIVSVSSERPKYIEWTPSETCLEGTETQKLTVPYTSAEVTISRNYLLPKTDLSAYQSIGVSGNWYFTYAYGNPGSFAFTSSFSINSTQPN